MTNQDKINKLLLELKSLTNRLNKVNESINEVEADGEDVIPGHDEGAEYWSRMIKYKILMEQVQLVKKELRNLGYKYV